MPKSRDLTGMTFGLLTVVEKAGVSEHGANLWTCSCQCGTVKTVVGHTMTSGGVKSCGCLRSMQPPHNKSHNRSGSPLYLVWNSMRNRCNNPNVKSYVDYGGRGIKVCERWASFDNFLADMGERPSPKHSIDLKDNTGDYSPENCHWVTRDVQVKNKRNNRYITANGETLTMVEWARRLGCNHTAIIARLNTGMSEEEAVTKPIPKRPNSKLTEDNVRYIRKAYPAKSTKQLAEELGVHSTSILNVLSGKNFADII